MTIKIISKKNLSDQLIRLEIKQSGGFDAVKPGQYVLLRFVAEETAITLPVIKTEPLRETITLMAASVSDKINSLWNPCVTGIQIALEGPFGQPFQIENFGTVLCIANHQSMVPLYPVLTALKAAGNHITCLLTSIPEGDSVLENEIRNLSDSWINSDENPRRASQILEQTLRIQKYDQVIAIGPAKTIREACTISTTTKTPIQAMLYLNEKNQKGQHGIFRVSVCGNTRALCVDGYNFNAYYTSYEEMLKRFGCERAEIETQRNINIPV